MLKHVQLSPCRSRADSVSLSSSVSYSSLQNGGSSPGVGEPLSSRSSSYTSLNEAPHMTTIKVYARCLRPDIEYKTLSISFSSTSRDVVQSLLNKYRMRHRDPNLFYLTMEVAVRKAGIRTMLVLDEDARPAELQSCHPRGDSRFALQMRRGGLVKIYDSILMSGSQYKSLLISERTTVDELIQILLNCYNSKERVEQFSVYEVCKSEEYERKLHPDDCPLRVQQFWAPPRQLHFMLRRNPDCPRPRRKIGGTWSTDIGLPPLPPPASSTVLNYQSSLPSLSSLMLREPSNKQQQSQHINTQQPQHINIQTQQHISVPQHTTIQPPPQYSNKQPEQQTVVQPVRTQITVTQRQEPVRAQLISRHRSSLLEDTLPRQLRSLHLSTPVSTSYTDYENYFYI